MNSECDNFDAIVIGGGFYGAVIAAYLKKSRCLNKVILLEKEDALLTRASRNNQARVHNGCHYPRSFSTAYRSRVNLPRFIQDWPQAVYRDFINLYAIAKSNSKVNAKQFERFCYEIGVKIKPAEARFKVLFDPLMIEDVFLVEEYAFDFTRLSEWAINALNNAGVEVRYLTRAKSISRLKNHGGLKVAVQQKSGGSFLMTSRYVINCTYSGLNQFQGDFLGTQTGLKHEIAEIALVEVPEILKEIGITVMDGPFFSMMPFPACRLHTLSHVRYTPHFSWPDSPNSDPYVKLEEYNHASRIDRMVRDAKRYLPSIQSVKYQKSLFEVKTILEKNEGDDGRPILFERHHELPGCYSILGGKIDNIYDVLEKLDADPFY